MGLERPHTATVRLTSEQFELAKERFDRHPGMSWQKLYAAATNAFIRGDLEIHPDGSYTVGEPDVFSYEDDAEALSLDDLDELDEVERVSYDTRALAKKAEDVTGRRVPLSLLRRLVRERFPLVENPGPGTRYRWPADHPDIPRIIEAIGDGVLDELRANVNSSFGSGARSL